MADSSGRDSKGIRFYGYSSEDEPQSKRTKHSNVDRLSELPDSLITHILSLMPVTDAVKTDLLSKHWCHRHAWTSSQTFVFGEHDEYRDSYYTRFITAALTLHDGPKIKKLSLPELLRNGLDPPLGLWLRVAVAKQVEELVLNIDCSIDPYSLPPSLVSCNTLTKFSLSATKIELGSVISWKSLKKLTLKYVRNLNNDMICKIVNCSPSLESLSLIDCYGYNRIFVPCGSNLRNLVINGYGNHHHHVHQGNNVDGVFIEISAPSVTTLEISGYLCRRHCRLKDVSSFVQVTLGYSVTTSVEDENGNPTEVVCRDKLRLCQWMLHLLLMKIRQVEKLVIGTWCTQVLSVCELRKMPSISLKCKNLELHTPYRTNLPGIARLLRGLPCLERLTVHMGHNDYHPNQLDKASDFVGFNGENYWKSEGMEISFLHLKVIQFKEPIGSMLELAEFLLKHALVLEEFHFQPGTGAFRQGCWVSDLQNLSVFKAMQKLLSYPRSSQQARVLLL